MSEWQKHPRILLDPEAHEDAEELAAKRGETMGQVLKNLLRKEKISLRQEAERRRGVLLN